MVTVEVISSVQRRRRWTAEHKKAMVLEAVASRFGDIDRLPQPIEWLSDNGPACIARDAVAFARSLGFVVCTTPLYSPESNGMADAFIKTFRRDDVDAPPLYDARYVLEQLPKWFEDYNEHHPHKALRMKSPREYRRYAAKLDECPAK